MEAYGDIKSSYINWTQFLFNLGTRIFKRNQGSNSFKTSQVICTRTSKSIPWTEFYSQFMVKEIHIFNQLHAQ